MIGIPRYQKDWSSFLEGKSWELQRLMIVGMFDTEGWCGNKKDLRLKLSQKNREKLIEVKKVLKKNNIQTGKLVVEHKDNHAIYICGKNVIIFIDKVGYLSKHPLKIVKFEKIKWIDS